MRAIWKGSISFGLANIPIALYPATREAELKFRLLRKSDLSPVNYKRVAEKNGGEVLWNQIVKGKFFSYPQIFGALDAPQIERNQALKICVICGFCLCAAKRAPKHPQRHKKAA